MLIIPAIDIQDGFVVRFVQGKLNKKVYSKDPLKTAKHWVRLGAKLIHLVDLDGASTGNPKNLEIVKEIVKNVQATKIEFGGGIRRLALIEELLAGGIWRVVLGTKALEDISFLKKAFKQFKNRIIVSIDANKDGQVFIKGWDKRLKGQSILRIATTLREIGLKQVIYTDISKDGTLTGPNIKGIKSFLKETGLKVIASGGIASLEDIRRLKLLEKKGLLGIIVGKALYEGKFTLTQALNKCAKRSFEQRGGLRI